MRTPLSFAVTALALLAALPASAIQQPRKDGVAAREFRHPGFEIRIDVVSPVEVPGEASSAARSDLAALGLAGSPAFVDGRTNRWATLFPAVPMIPGAANQLAWGESGLAAMPRGDSEVEAAAWATFARWLSEHRAELRIDPAELGQARVTVHGGGRLVQIWVPRQVAGVPVRRAALTAVISQGNLSLFGTEIWGDIAVSPRPTLAAADALPVLLGHLAPYTPVDTTRKARLELVPLARGEDPRAVAPGQGLEYRLAWVLQPRFDGSDTEWEALVDAHSGELIAFEDKTNYASTRNLVGGVYPLANDGDGSDGTLQSYPLPFAHVTTGVGTFATDSGGNLATCVDGSISTVLAGPYVVMNDVCGAISESAAGAVLDLGGAIGTTPHDCTVPAGHSAGDTASARSAFSEINKIAEMGRGHLPNNTWLRTPLPVQVNILDTCNASGGPAQLRFFRSGGGCTNTGEIAGVFDHEWGHGMDGADAAPGISNPGEGIADIYASLRLNTSCIGRNFQLGDNCGGYGDPCTQCDGVRDIDYAKRSSGNPHNITFIGPACGSGNSTPCGGSTHCEGSVYAESVWDLWNRDLIGAPFGMSLDTAREVATRLTFTGGQLVTTWFQCSQGSGGCPATSGYMNYLAADDDDGNLTNGTPHMQAIHAAFNRHGIACSTPTVQNSGCAGAPTMAPTVTTQPLDRGALVSWTAVAGADSYRVYRTEGVAGCDYGKTLIGETTSTTWTDDDGLANGRTYNYMVIAMGDGDACFGPASACSAVVPAPAANLAILTGAVSMFSGDGDAFVDNCESARVTFPVDNIGAGTQNNVRVASVTSSSHPGLDAGISFPAAFAHTLAACGRAVGGFDFAPSGLAEGDTIRFDVALTSDELSPATKSTQIEIRYSEQDLQFAATKTYTFESGTEGWTVETGTFNRTGGGAANGTTFSERSSTLLDNQCDRVRSPLLQLSSSSTLSLWNNYTIEPQSGGTWYDRANVALERLDGTRTLVAPTSGRLYNAGPGGPGAYSGCNDPETGWAGTQNSWSTSSWNAGAFGGTVPSGTLAQLEVTYSTDGGSALAGFRFDEVTVTDVSILVSDAQGNSCTSDFLFADDYESAGTSFWDATTP